MAIGSGEIATRTDTIEFREKPALIIKCADVFDDSIGIGDVKGVVRKRKCSTITCESGHLGITFFEEREITHAHRGNFFFMGIKFFQVVVGSGILGGIDADVHNTFLCFRGCEGEKLRKFLGPAFGRNTIGDFLDN